MHVKSPFIVNAFELASHPEDFEIDSPPEALELNLEKEVKFVQPVRGRLSWRWVDGRVVCLGHLKTTAELGCVRCLKPLRRDLSLDIRLVFTDEPPEEETVIDLDAEDDEGLIHFLGDRIDAREELRASILVELPDLPLCDEACEGLCAGCGANLNNEACRCDPEEKEKSKDISQWQDQLAKLRDQLNLK